jgi:hypothetical protein
LDSVQQISRLRKLENLKLFLSSIESKLAFEVLLMIQYFTQIKFLDLTIRSSDRNYKVISLKTLKNCKQLIYLSLNYSKVSDNTFKDIDFYLPKLK